MNKPNPIQMQKYLGGISYPTNRDNIVEHARSSGADEEILDHLKALPDGEFDGPNAVSQAFSKET